MESKREKAERLKKHGIHILSYVDEETKTMNLYWTATREELKKYFTNEELEGIDIPCKDEIDQKYLS